MAFDLSEIVNDPDLTTGFTIVRTTGSFAAAGWQAGTPVEIPASGVFVPADDEALSQVPEGDRVIGGMQLLCQQQIYHTEQGRLSDQVRWNGQLYRVLSVAPWREFGFWSAILVRTAGK